MANNLYGTEFIERQRSSGYKSTIYAIAELVDNSVDAGANNIDIVIVEKEKAHGQGKTLSVSNIIVTDDGKGMGEDTLNTCLTFSEGEGTNHTRIGKFGVGLPNSSISVGRRVEVYSKLKGTSNWLHVFLDLDEQKNRNEPGYDDAIEKTPSADILSKLNKGVNTIIIWSKIDRLDASRAQTFIKRGNILLGRIYRYKINSGLNIVFTSYIENNNSPSLKKHKLIPYDPLFLTTNENYITPIIWNVATNQEPAGINKELGDIDKKYTSSFHYKKFTKGYIENKTNGPLYQKETDAFNIEHSVYLNGKEYKYIIKAAFAYKDITKPGIREGGKLKIGQEMRKKMIGTKDFKSANIYFIRAGREIDFGSYGLYSITKETSRWWTIEIHFDSDLDDLMGISNTKQSVDFNVVQSEDIQEILKADFLTTGQMKEILWESISKTIIASIRRMEKYLSGYAKAFKNEETIDRRTEVDPKNPIPTPERPIIDVIGKAKSSWTSKQIDDMTSFLKKRYMQIPIEQIRAQVNHFSKGLTKTVVIYSPTETNSLYEITEIVGKPVVLINVNHSFYTNIIEPLKSSANLKEFAIAIEMLISSFALTMKHLIEDDEEKFQWILDYFIEQSSSRLNVFMHDLNMSIDANNYKDEEEIEMEESL
jgi:hypothetical protein